MNQGSLTAVLLVAAVGTVLEPVTPEAADDAVDAAGTGEERGAAFRFSLGCGGKNKTNSSHQEAVSRPWRAHPANSGHAMGLLTLPGNLQKFLTTTTHLRCPAGLEAHMLHPPGVPRRRPSACGSGAPSKRAERQGTGERMDDGWNLFSRC